VSELHLRFTTGPHAGLHYAAGGTRVRIGRSRDNDVVLDDDGTPDASRHHAEAVLERGDWWIADLGAANGTLVNGRRIDRARLRDGDQVALGAHVLAVRITDRTRGRWAAGVVGAALTFTLVALLVVGRKPAGFQDAATRAEHATYLVATEDANHRAVVGTAFAGSDDGLFATNAHVAHEVQRRVTGGQRAMLIRTEPTPDVRPVAALWAHPGWAPGSIRDDVAVLQARSGTRSTPLPLADTAALGHVRRGTAVALFGFPAASTDLQRPRGRLNVDMVGDIRSGRYFAVGLNILPGTSGSPIFLDDGTVVALAAGGDFGRSRATGTPVGSGANWGVSVVALRELLATVTRQP
jgi:predicted component of type VI protein secretion system